MDVSFRNAPLNYVLTAIEPKLAMPIGRVGIQIPPGAAVVEPDGTQSGDPSPPVSLELHDVSAGMVLEQALNQVGLGYEMTTGFVILPAD